MKSSREKADRIDFLCAELTLKLSAMANRYVGSRVTPIFCEEIREELENTLEAYLERAKPEDQN